MKRRSYRISRVGSLNNLNLVEEEIPSPADNEICIEVKAIGLNFADVFTIFGLYKAAPKRDFIPGLEFSGVVIDKGKNATSVEVGDRIMGSIRFGSYTTHLNIDHRYIIKLPEDWSFEEGASFIVQALTAYYALVPLGGLVKTENPASQQKILIHSAAGGVGIYANRIAKKFSAYTIGTVGNSSKMDLLKSEGYDGIMVRDRHFKNELAKYLNGRKLDLVLDSIGGKIQKASFDQLTTTGRLVAYGLSQFASPGASPDYLKLALQFITMPRYQTLTLIESNKSVLGFNLIWLYDRYDMWTKLLFEIEALHLDKPYVGNVFPFEKLKEAVRVFQAGGTMGKVVVKV